MEFPRLVFKCPGDMPRKGGTFKVLQVLDDASHDESLAGGWFATLPEAIEAHDNPKPVQVAAALSADDVSDYYREKMDQAGITTPVDSVKTNEVPTRAELEEKARALGLKFDGRTSDAKLSKLIDEA